MISRERIHELDVYFFVKTLHQAVQFVEGEGEHEAKTMFLVNQFIPPNRPKLGLHAIKAILKHKPYQWEQILYYTHYGLPVGVIAKILRLHPQTVSNIKRTKPKHGEKSLQQEVDYVEYYLYSLPEKTCLQNLAVPPLHIRALLP